MKLLGTLIAAAAVASVIPYKINVDENDKSLNAKALIYDINVSTGEDGQKKVNISFFGDIKKAAKVLTEKKEEPEAPAGTGECCEGECDDFTGECCEDACECPTEAPEAPAAE